MGYVAIGTATAITQKQLLQFSLPLFANVKFKHSPSISGFAKCMPKTDLVLERLPRLEIGPGREFCCRCRVGGRRKVRCRVRCRWQQVVCFRCRF